VSALGRQETLISRRLTATFNSKEVMAEWGKGDPRWIVEERPDATNVNNWHWTEKDATSWSKEKLKELLLKLDLANASGACSITEVLNCEGEASASNRKGKIIVFYEWDLKLKWKGKLFSVDKSITGTIKIPNLSDENTIDDLDIQIFSEKSTAEEEKMKEGIRNEGIPKIRDQLQKYMDALKKEYTQDMVLPTKDAVRNTTCSESKVANISSGMEKSCTVNGTTSVLKGPSIPKVTKFLDYETSTELKCKALDAYNALTHPPMFAAFTNGSGHIEPKVGGKFDIFGGNVHGEIIELKSPVRIVQKWRFKHWPVDHYSNVSFSILQESEATTLKVSQTGIPESDYEKTKEGWERYYFDAIKRTFGYGSFL
jgi:activator of HSP90 ATPase